jgi:hypothetical protein
VGRRRRLWRGGTRRQYAPMTGIVRRSAIAAAAVDVAPVLRLRATLDMRLLGRAALRMHCGGHGEPSPGSAWGCKGRRNGGRCWGCLTRVPMARAVRSDKLSLGHSSRLPLTVNELPRPVFFCSPSGDDHKLLRRWSQALSFNCRGRRGAAGSTRSAA